MSVSSEILEFISGDIQEFNIYVEIFWITVSGDILEFSIRKYPKAQYQEISWFLVSRDILKLSIWRNTGVQVQEQQISWS